jgi:signal transduction histidine kinase
MQLLPRRPAYALLLIALLGLLFAAGAVRFALQQPWLGVHFAVTDDGKALEVSEVASPFSQHIPLGVKVQRLISASGVSIEMLPSDLIEEPDFFDSYAEMSRFFARQRVLNGMLHEQQLDMVWQDQKGIEGRATIVMGQRPLSDLPVVFWFQLFSGLAGLLIASWIYLLRKDDWGTRMFGLTGLFFLICIIPAAIYSTRELALQGDTFRVLASLNHFGAAMFGCALVALFLVYPRRLVQPRALLVLPLFFGTWLASDIFRWAANQNWGSRILVSFEMLLAIIFAVVQWQKTRGQPLERAALRWFTSSVLLGCSLFITTTYGASVLGLFPAPQQGYAFGFFLIMYVGIALGLRHYQLFEMDKWVYRSYLWIAGAALVMGLDGLLIYMGLTQTASLGITLLVSGWIYFPLRQWLWQRIVNKRAPDIGNLLPELSAIAFTAPLTEQQERWAIFLSSIFDPLEIKQKNDGAVENGVGENGLALYVPSSGTLSAYALRYAGRGTRLFSSRDAVFAASLSRLLEQVMSGRSNYEQGVAQERLRIGRDLHDNIGARLLKLIHHLRGTSNADIARDAMNDLRTSIAALDGQPVPLNNALADWRAEAGARCEVANCRLQWKQGDLLPNIELPPRVKATLESVMREIITNALKHATPSHIHVEISIDASRLQVSVENDGDIANPLTWEEGYGLRNIRGRLSELGGSMSIAAAENEVRLTLIAPMI